MAGLQGMASWCRLRGTLNWHIAPARTPYFPELKRLREVCARAVDPGFAFIRIMSMPSTVCLALGLLYEAVSGQSDADLKRACDSCSKM